MPALGNNELTLTITAKDGASDVLKKVNKSVGDLGEEAGGSNRALELLGTGVSKIASIAKTAFIAAGTAASGFGIVAAKASWDQASAVEQATLALRAYEKDGTKVNNVLKDLIAYARSDMGVLFNRKDLFAAAQGLKIMGDNTNQLSQHVQIMSRSVGLGLSTWEDLTQIIGRVGSTSQLTGDDFDNLTKAGFKLNPALRNTKITFDQLFKALDKGIPADALAGQANTIEGLGIRFQTAFRGIGDAILGVDSETSKFIEGGLGDRLTKGLAMATQGLKNLKPYVSDAATVFRLLFDTVIGGDPTLRENELKFVGLVRWLLQTRDAVIDAATKVKDILRPAFEGLGKAVVNDLLPALGNLWKNVLQPMAPVVGVVLVSAFAGLINVFSRVVSGASFLIDLLSKYPILVAAIGGVIAAFLVPPMIAWAAAALSAAAGTLAAIAPIVAIGAAIGAVAYLIVSNWGTIVSVWNTVTSFIGEKVNWLKDHFWEAIGYIIGFFATLPIKLPLLMFDALSKIVNAVLSINWGAVFSAIGNAFVGAMKWVADAAVNTWNFLKSINWGDVLVGIGKGIGNAILGLIEGAINGALSGIPGSPKVHLPRFARGTNYAPGGLALVGEDGPELVNLPRGSQVKTAAQTRQTLSQAGSGPQFTVTQNIYNQMDYDKSFAELGFMLRAA